MPGTPDRQHLPDTVMLVEDGTSIRLSRTGLQVVEYADLPAPFDPAMFIQTVA
jgi:hypothetical protein